MALYFKLWFKSQHVTIKIKVTKPYFPLLLFDMLYKVLLISISVTIQMRGTKAVLSCGAVYYVVQGGSYFLVFGENPKVWALTKDE